MRWLLPLLVPLLLEGLVQFDARVDVYGRALYWRPTHAGGLYAILQIPSQPADALLVEPRSRFGFEVGTHIRVMDDQLGLGGGYLSYNVFSQRTTVEPPGTVMIPSFFFAPGADAQVAKASLESHYRRGDLFATWLFAAYGGFRAESLAGVRYFNARETEVYNYIVTSVIFPPSILGGQVYTWRGWGPRVGGRVSWTPWRNLSLHAEVAAMAARTKGRLNINSTLGFLLLGVDNLNYPKQSTIDLAVDLCITAAAWLPLGELRIQGEIGYALDTYFNVRSRLEAVNVARTPDRSTAAAGYGGPFAGLSVEY